MWKLHMQNIAYFLFLDTCVIKLGFKTCDKRNEVGNNDAW